jgi:hypothetical protein
MKRLACAFTLLILLAVTPGTARDTLCARVDDYIKGGATKAAHSRNIGRLLSQRSLRQMWTPVKLNNGKTHDYGFGWGLGYVRRHRIIEHGGAWQGFKAPITRYVDDKLTVIVFANLAQANPGKIAHGIAAIYNPELAPAAPNQ